MTRPPEDHGTDGSNPFSGGGSGYGGSGRSGSGPLGPGGDRGAGNPFGAQPGQPGGGYGAPGPGGPGYGGAGQGGFGAQPDGQPGYGQGGYGAPQGGTYGGPGGFGGPQSGPPGYGQGGFGGGPGYGQSGPQSGYGAPGGFGGQGLAGGMPPGGQGPAGGPGGGSGGKGPLFLILGLVLVAVLAIAGIAYAVARGGDDSTESTPVPQASNPVAARTPSSSAASAPSSSPRSSSTPSSSASAGMPGVNDGPTPTISVPSGTTARVRLEVTGTAPSDYGFIMYMDPATNETEQLDSFTTPWSKELSVSGGYSSIFLAASTGQDGDLTCAVYVNDQKATEAKASGDFENAHCTVFIKP